MTLDTGYFEQHIKTLERAFTLLKQTSSDHLDYDMYRSACIKEFEIILEQSAKLLRKVLKPYFHSPKEVDGLYFKDVFRHAVLRNIISDEACERWMQYRDNRNITTHDYGVKFATETLILLTQFIVDSTHLAELIKQHNNL